jgi:hypothetical protein
MAFFEEIFKYVSENNIVHHLENLTAFGWVDC